MSAGAIWGGFGGVLVGRRGHLARLHLIEPPPGSTRAIDARREWGGIKAYFTARRLGMTPAKIAASRTAAHDRLARVGL